MRLSWIIKIVNEIDALTFSFHLILNNFFLSFFLSLLKEHKF
jgi:hypothetical protein